MTDVHSKSVRSFNMSRIKSKNTKPEIVVRKFLYSNGFRYRLHRKNLPGTPDIVLPKYRTIINVHGCFWHGHNNCKYYILPKTRTEWWAAKIERNKKKDVENSLALQRDNWKIIDIWECELKKEKIDFTLQSLLETLVNQNI